MKKYTFFIDITGSITIEADSYDEARELVTPEEVSRLFNEGLMSTDITFNEDDEE
jgi:2-hydroxy-3-keto-5-methylthiopentenyl-1-phosphate phosphatase